MRRFPAVVLAVSALALTSTMAWAQAAGSIAGSIWGKVTDETGAVLPGVTVSVGGPAMMGRSVSVTNEQGVYRFPSLPPGEYKLTFTLAGFNTLEREGIRLTANFTATVDAQLKLSTVQETVEVRGGSPVVDIVNTRVATNFSKDQLASVPSSRDLWSLLSEAPAVQMVGRMDVGGSTAGTQTSYVAYGVQGQNKPVVEGVIAIEGSSSTGFYYDYGSFDEVNIGAASQSAEMATPGVQSVFVSKSGGNEYHGDFYADYETKGMEGHNIDATQLAKGVLADSNRIEDISDINANGGGFIKKDRVWWFGSFRRQKLEVQQPTLASTAFLTRITDYTGKLTYQLPKNNKLTAYVMYGIKRQPYRGRALAVSSSSALNLNQNSTWNQYNPGWVWKVEWDRTFGSNLFVEARVGHWGDRWHQSRWTDEPRREDLVTQVVSGGTYNWYQLQNRPQTTGALTYFKDGWAGTHQFKVGWEIQKEDVEQIWYDAYPGNVVNVFRDGVPAEVYLTLAPLDSRNQLFWYAGYAADTWTMGPLSFNLGVRLDHYRSAYPDQSRPANPFAPALDVPGNENLATWNEFAPRIGVSWNVNGDGRNVIKANFGRYYYNPSMTLGDAVNPNTSPQWTRYNWTDTNNNRQWDRGEEGKVLAVRGAGARAALASDLVDPHVDEFATWFERQVANNFGLRTGFVYKHTLDPFQTLNVLNPFDAFNIATTAVDPGLDGVTGTSDDHSLSAYNLDPSLIGNVANTLVNAPNYTTSAYTWEIAANRRFTNRWSLAASYAITWRNDYNAIPANPNDPQQTQQIPISFFKANASFEPGFGFRLTPVIRFQQGDPFARQVSVRLNYGSQVMNAEPNGSERRDSIALVDLRTERKFSIKGSTSFSVFADAFNIFNSNAATSSIITTGSSFLRPTLILAPRVFRLGAKFSF